MKEDSTNALTFVKASIRPQRILHYGGKYIKEEDHPFVTFVAKDTFN